VPLKRRGISVLVIASLTVLALVAAFFIADAMLRRYAENRVQDEIAGNLPDSVSGDVTVSIKGISVIAQYLAGNFDRVDLDAPALTVNGAAASVHLVATDVPTERTKPVGAVHGTIDLGEKSLNTLLAASDVPGTPELRLGDGEVSYDGEVSVFGLPIGYQATATPEPAGDSIVFTPKAAKVTSGAGSIDVSGIVQRVLDGAPLEVCVATYLPDGVELSGVDVTPDRARMTLDADDLRLDQASLSTVGTC
jgi:hypothetical protein